MSMTRCQLQGLADLAERYWLSAVAYAHGYECHLKNSLSLGTWLNWTTITCAILTAGSTVEDMGIHWLPMATALLTAAIAAILKVLAPSTRGVEYADIIKNLEVIQSDITMLAIRMESIPSFSVVQDRLTSIQASIQGARRIPITLTDDDYQFAESQLVQSSIASLTSRLEASIQPTSALPPVDMTPQQLREQVPRGDAPSFEDMDERDDTGVELPADAPDMIGTTRRQHTE